MIRTLSLFALSIFIYINTFAQNTRSRHYNSIGWYNYFGTINLNKKIGLHTEYQWRRANVITDWQQSLLRLGVNYTLNPNVLFRVGYGWIETFPYGDIPINGFGKDFTEHRIFEMVQLTQKVGRVDFSHRFMLEQRFVGSYSTANLDNEDTYRLLHRVRYMFRVQVPLVVKDNPNNTPYVALYDEVFIGFGRNVAANVFDQNRIGLVLGYRFNNNIRIEAGYINQIVQFGRTINSQNIFQYNNGLIINSNFNINLH